MPTGSAALRFILLFAAGLAVIFPAPLVAHGYSAQTLQWDATTKELQSEPGQKTAEFVFTGTNRSPAELIVTATSSSCRCVTVRTPRQPWRIAPGASGTVRVEVNLAGKGGEISETIWVETTQGMNELKVRIQLPERPAKSMPRASHAGRETSAPSLQQRPESSLHVPL